MRSWIVVAALGAAAVNAAAEDAPERSWGVNLEQKFTGGAGGYRMSDTYVGADLPFGIGLNAGLNVYESDSSTATPTITAGASWTRDHLTLDGSWSITTLANDYSADAYRAGATVRAGEADWRTTLSAALDVTHHHYHLRNAVRSVRSDNTQRSGTATLRQRLFGRLQAEVSATQYGYVENILNYTRALNRPRVSRALGRYAPGLAGLLQGFPDHSHRVGLSYDFAAVPVTVSGAYEGVKMMDTAFGVNGTADDKTADVSWNVTDRWTVGAEYGHLRQTGTDAVARYGGRVGYAF